MNKEALKKEAEEKADIYVEDKYDEENDCFSLGYARFVEGFLAGAEPREKRIADLKKENESLLGKLAIRGSKLIKAKELLREIIDTPVFSQIGGELYENEGYTELVAEVEQFLKENE